MHMSSRNNRRGMVDLIFMILMIVLVLGMATLAFFAYDNAEKEKVYVARIEQVPAKQLAELDSTRARYAEVCKLIGFKGNADFSSEAAIRLRLQNAVGYDPKLGLDDQDLQKIETYGITAASPGEKGQVVMSSAGRIDGVAKNSEPVYEYSSTYTVEKALGAQDELINSLVTKGVPDLRKQRENQREWHNAEVKIADDNSTATDKKVADQLEADTSILRSEAEKASQAEADLAEAQAKENEAFVGLNNKETRDATNRVFDKQKEILLERQRTSGVQRDYRSKSNTRSRDDSRDFDGAIFQVDEESGWVWINIGKASDVRLNTTFQVLRADTSNSSEVSVGEIRVKELLGRNMARCRVDNLDDQGVYPEQGDLIRNPNFSSRQYQTYCLVGEFGGKFSELTKQQITDMLRGAGFTVVSKVTGATDALVIGGNWTKDPEFEKAKEERYNLETFSVEDVLFFLGRSID